LCLRQWFQRQSDIVSASYGSYKGYVAENFVAAELRSAGVDELNSWKGASSEIEFLVPVEGLGAVPVEVKSGKNTAAAGWPPRSATRSPRAN